MALGRVTCSRDHPSMAPPSCIVRAPIAIAPRLNSGVQRPGTRQDGVRCRLGRCAGPYRDREVHIRTGQRTDQDMAAGTDEDGTEQSA
eukprot:2802788-Rhodomonas_salina.2